MIIFRYLSREVLHTLIAISAILLLIFLSNLFVRYLGYAADGSIPMGLVLKIVAIQIPYLLSLLLPLGFFIAILLAYGRLYADSEMTVLFACGMSRGRLIQITMVMALILALIVAVMMFWMVPRLLTYRNHLIAQAHEDVETQLLFPGSFQQMNRGAQVVYVESLNGKRNRARNVFVAMRSQEVPASDMNVLTQKQSEWEVISAQSARRQIDPKQHAQYIVLNDGYRYVGTPGDMDYSITQFATFGLRVNRKVATPSQHEKSLPTGKLLADYQHNDRYAAEIQWRIAMPVATFVLALLGVALSRIDPRKGKYAQLLPSAAVAIIYANLLFVARNWIHTGHVSPFWGIWWVHLSFFMIAVALLHGRHYYARLYCFWKQFTKRNNT